MVEKKCLSRSELGIIEALVECSLGGLVALCLLFSHPVGWSLAIIISASALLLCFLAGLSILVKNYYDYSRQQKFLPVKNGLTPPPPENKDLLTSCVQQIDEKTILSFKNDLTSALKEIEHTGFMALCIQQADKKEILSLYQYLKDQIPSEKSINQSNITNHIKKNVDHTSSFLLFFFNTFENKIKSTINDHKKQKEKLDTDFERYFAPEEEKKSNKPLTPYDEFLNLIDFSTKPRRDSLTNNNWNLFLTKRTEMENNGANFIRNNTTVYRLDQKSPTEIKKENGIAPCTTAQKPNEKNKGSYKSFNPAILFTQETMDAWNKNTLFEWFRGEKSHSAGECGTNFIGSSWGTDKSTVIQYGKTKQDREYIYEAVIGQGNMATEVQKNRWSEINVARTVRLNQIKHVHIKKTDKENNKVYWEKNKINWVTSPPTLTPVILQKNNI